MSRHEHKARGKVTQKLTRDGLVERNAATGEEERLSQRSTDFDLRGAKADDHALSQTRTKKDGNQSTAQRNRAAYKQAEETPTTVTTEVRQETPLQFASSESQRANDNVFEDNQADNEPSESPRQDESSPLRQERNQHQQPPSVNSRAPHNRQQEYYQQFNKPKTTSEKPSELSMNSTDVQSEPAPSKRNTERESKLNNDTDSALRFSRDETPPQGQAKRPKQQYGKAEQPVTETAQPQSVAQPPPTVPVAPVILTTAPVTQKPTEQTVSDMAHDAEIPQTEPPLKEPETAPKPGMPWGKRNEPWAKALRQCYHDTCLHAP
jgi:hypothetical protein